MALWVCKQCTAAYAVRANKCPHCGAPNQELTTLPAATAPEPAPEAVETAEGQQQQPKPTRRRKEPDQ